MLFPLKPYSVIFFAGILSGYLLTHYFCHKAPPLPSIETKVVTNTQTKVVTRTVLAPNGTTVITKIEDSTTNTQLQNSTVQNPSFKYKVTPLFGYSFKDNKQTFGLLGEKYLTPDLTYGAYIFPVDHHIGFTLSYSF